MLDRLRHVLPSRRGDDGATAVEYGLLVAAIAAIIIAIVFAVGGYVKGGFQETCREFNASGAVRATSPGGTCNP